MIIQTIIATEHDGLNTRTLAIHCEILDKKPHGFNLKEAAEKAVKEYLHTPDGKQTYEYNCKNFNWADFDLNVPNEICEKYGFRKRDTDFTPIEVDWDETLADEIDFMEFWDLDE